MRSRLQRCLPCEQRRCPAANGKDEQALLHCYSGSGRGGVIVDTRNACKNSTCGGKGNLVASVAATT